MHGPLIGGLERGLGYYHLQLAVCLTRTACIVVIVVVVGGCTHRVTCTQFVRLLHTTRRPAVCTVRMPADNRRSTCSDRLSLAEDSNQDFYAHRHLILTLDHTKHDDHKKQAH